MADEGTGALQRLERRGLAVWALLPQPVRVRVIPVVLALGTGTVLAVAAWLTPNPEGHATHLQLGLNPCTILSVTGYPCPVCGATTTFSLWAHFRPIEGFWNQPFASLLFWMTVGTFSISAAEILQPRRRWERLLAILAPYEMRLVAAFLAIMLASWAYKVVLMG